MAKTISLWTKNWMTKNKIPFYFLEFATSSNDLAKEKAFKNLASPTVFLVDQQTKGRGYENKTWENSDLMISFLWEDQLKEIKLSSCKNFALDLQEALKKVWPQLDAWVKAPNDLYINEGKTAGLLLEILNQGSKKALIIGLGLNVFSCPKNLKAAYLAEQTENIHSDNWELFLNHLFSFWCKRASLNKISSEIQ